MGCHAFLQGTLPDLGIELVSLISSAWAGGFFNTSDTWEAPDSPDAPPISQPAVLCSPDV